MTERLEAAGAKCQVRLRPSPERWAVFYSLGSSPAVPASRNWGKLMRILADRVGIGLPGLVLVNVAVELILRRMKALERRRMPSACGFG
jgi:hypothetical protein